MAKKFAEAAAEAGIPESPIMHRVLDDGGADPILDLHVGGVRIGDLPIEAQGRILYQQTDEGIAENNAGKSPKRFEVTRDEFTKTLDHRRDAVKDFGMALDEAPNPTKELMDKHIKPGMRGRILSPKVIERKGMRGWEPVLDENGQQVKLRDAILGQMPEDRAKQRNRQVRERGRQLLGEVTQKYLAEGKETALADQ